MNKRQEDKKPKKTKFKKCPKCKTETLFFRCHHCGYEFKKK